MDIIGKSEVKMAEFTAVITRADGTTVNLGRVAYYHKNPVMRVVNWVKAQIKRI